MHGCPIMTIYVYLWLRQSRPPKLAWNLQLEDHLTEYNPPVAGKHTSAIMKHAIFRLIFLISTISLVPSLMLLVSTTYIQLVHVATDMYSISTFNVKLWFMYISVYRVVGWARATVLGVNPSIVGVFIVTNTVKYLCCIF